jgi:hypothetical protein
VVSGRRGEHGQKEITGQRKQLNNAMGKIHGACFCGKIEFEIEGTTFNSTICHCPDCQRFSGAPLMASACFRSHQVQIIKGEPKAYRYGEGRIRFFCDSCGSQLFFTRADFPDDTEVFLGSLEGGASVAPASHTWTGDSAPYIRISDDLPKYLEDETN